MPAVGTRRRQAPQAKDVQVKAPKNISVPEVEGEVDFPEGDLVRVMSTFRNKYHSGQRVTIPQGSPVPVIRDNWVEVQLAAGVLVEVE